VLAYSGDEYFLVKSLRHLPADRYAVTVVAADKLPAAGAPAPEVWGTADA